MSDVEEYMQDPGVILSVPMSSMESGIWIIAFQLGTTYCSCFNHQDIEVNTETGLQNSVYFKILGFFFNKIFKFNIYIYLFPSFINRCSERHIFIYIIYCYKGSSLLF